MQFDSNGLIVTLKNDGGDTCAEEGRYWFLYWFNFVFMSNYTIALKIPQRVSPSKLIAKLETSPGKYVRNPAPAAAWEADPKTTSRDQLIPIIYYCAAYKDYKRLARLFWACLKRGMFAQNVYSNWYTGTPKWKVPDQMLTCIPDFIRAGGKWTAVLYPLLLVLDLVQLLSVLVALIPVTVPDSAKWYNPLTWFAKRGLDDVDDNNLDIAILGAVAFKPTPLSYVARKLWGRFRPANYGNSVLGITNNCLAAIAWYHDPRFDGNKEVIELFDKPLSKYLTWDVK